MRNKRTLGVAIVPLLLLAVDLPVLSRPAASRPATRAGRAQKDDPRRDQTRNAAPQRNEAGVLAEHIPHARLLDQNGKRVLLHEVLNANVVVINFIYTSCTAFCGLQAANFARLQKLLASKQVTDVRLLSITTDPKTDTPARLKKWAAELGWKPGWLLLTGAPEELEPVLGALTGGKGGRGLHSTIALVANPSKGVWIRTDALETPEQLAEMIHEVRSHANRKSY
jgi:protein SCO1/2